MSMGMQRNKAVLAFCMTALALFVGFGDMLGGYDRYIYAELSDSMADQISYGDYSIKTSSVADLYTHEYGYQVYNFLVGLITENRYIFILITTCIIYVLLFKAIKNYCINYPFAVILFLGLWFFFSFTYLRQVMGATIAWLAIKYIAKRDLKKYLLIMAIAWSFHNSAIILFPMYWVPIKKFNKYVIIVIMLIAFGLGLTGGPSALFAAYGEVDEERAKVGGNITGFRIAYVIEAIFFLYLIFRKYNDIPKKPLNLVLLNMALIFCAILLFFVKNENGGRLGWYYMIGVISTVTYICTKSIKSHKYAILMTVVCFFLYFRIASSWGIQLRPYKTFLTDGVRKGDLIEMEYEYDHNYDYDKFYRPAFRFMDKK